MPTPRKATLTPLKVRPARYSGIEKYVVERVYEDRKDAEKHVTAVNMFEELVKALGVALQTIQLGPNTIAKGNTVPFIKEIISRASSEGSK